MRSSLLRKPKSERTSDRFTQIFQFVGRFAVFAQILFAALSSRYEVELEQKQKAVEQTSEDREKAMSQGRYYSVAFDA